MLQQGHFSADVAYFYGEEGPLTAVFGWKPIADAPDGYGFDFVNSDVVLHELQFKDGRLVTPGGTSYRILYLGGRSQRMTLPVLRQIDEPGHARRGARGQPARRIRRAWRTIRSEEGCRRDVRFQQSWGMAARCGLVRGKSAQRKWRAQNGKGVYIGMTRERSAGRARRGARLWSTPSPNPTQI